MKKIFTLLCLTFLISKSYATIITVSNNPQNPAQFTGVETAVAEAAAGDTLYINGSEKPYGTITIVSRL